MVSRVCSQRRRARKVLRRYNVDDERRRHCGIYIDELPFSMAFGFERLLDC